MTDDATVAEIKAALRACKSITEVNSTAVHYASDVTALQKSRDRAHKTMAIQIINLAAYRRWEFKEASR